MDYWEQYVERPLEALGLQSPYLRFAAFAVLSGLSFNYAKPESMFDEKGAARPWTMTNPDNPDATEFPWWVVSAFLGIFAVLFI